MASARIEDGIYLKIKTYAKRKGISYTKLIDEILDKGILELTRDSIIDRLGKKDIDKIFAGFDRMNKKYDKLTKEYQEIRIKRNKESVHTLRKK